MGNPQITTPHTAENFSPLCTGEKGIGGSGKPLHYKGSTFSRKRVDLRIEVQGRETGTPARSSSNSLLISSGGLQSATSLESDSNTVFDAKQPVAAISSLATQPQPALLKRGGEGGAGWILLGEVLKAGGDR
nr:Peptidyl-prolyl cis-trans isomerase [Ipomoea batatas]